MLLPLAPEGLLFLYMGLVDEVGDESLGELFGLKVNPFKDELIISIGRKHWASGLKVEVTSRSALLSSGESCFCSEYRIYDVKGNEKRKIDIKFQGRQKRALSGFSP